MQHLEIQEIDILPLRSTLTDHFTIATGTQTSVDNLLVQVTLENNITGYGEIAPFEMITGETLLSSRKTVLQLSNHLKGVSAAHYRALSAMMEEKMPGNPAARCGLEMAILDAFSRSLNLPLWELMGARQLSNFTTDITIPILPLERSVELAQNWTKKGFNVLKMKVGANPNEELEIIQQIHASCKNCQIILDANQGFDDNEALLFIKEVLSYDCNVILYEQPLAKDNLDGLSKLRKMIPVPIVADESALTREDVKKIIQFKAADVINLKIMKSGIIQSLDMAQAALTMGLKLMIGGMLETRLAMGCSLALAAGIGGISYFDLDTPLLMQRDPFVGGYQYDGPHLLLSDGPGLGVTLK